VIAASVIKSLELANATATRFLEFNGIAPEEFNQELREATSEIRDKVYGANNQMLAINERLQELDDAQRKYRALLAEGDRIQQERQIFRQRAAAVIQGFRTRDAAFRIFRNEKLERYKTLFDLAAQYAFMAAQAYDYETGLLHTEQGRDFISRIVRARALGVVQNGEPQFAGSNTGDPGLSSVMAEMFADWSVLKGRLGFNNPDAYGTTVSLRTENYRILPGTNGNDNWKEILNQARKANILDDPDVRRYCLQIEQGNPAGAGPVPGLVLEFSTTIAKGFNLFGHPLAADDHAYSPSSFATKIFAAGVALDGYLGMDDPAANAGAVAGASGNSPADPNLAFLDPNHLSATPYIYLVPVGVDSMRGPPLGEVSEVRTWAVDDVAVPLPFNIGGSEFSAAQLYQSSDSLSEEPFAIRKHQAFRPVSSASLFDPSIYNGDGGLRRSQFTNNRLVGRSVWNSKWKLIIPGDTLLNNPDEGLERFLRTVNDVKLHFVTYSYSGN
jgi:prophage maintenance system killer protein